MAVPKIHTVQPHSSNLHTYFIHTSAMPDENLFRAFMDVVKNSSTLSSCVSRNKVNSIIIKNLLDDYESHQLSRTRQERERLVDTNNKDQITRWSQEQLGLNHSNQSYTNLELLIACQIWVLYNTSYAQLKSEYGIPKSTLKSYLEKVCPPLQCRNFQHIHQILKKGEVLISKVLEMIKISVQINKFGKPTYLNSDEESLVVALADRRR